MESLHLRTRTRIGALNLVGAPDSDPARREAISIEPHRSAALRFTKRLLRFIEGQKDGGRKISLFFCPHLSACGCGSCRASTIRASRFGAMNGGCWHGVPALAGRTSCRLKAGLL